MKKFPLVVLAILALMLTAMAIVIMNSQSSLMVDQATIESNPPNICVDFEGNPLSDGPCSTVPSESRSCQKTEDCQATCGFGCVNTNWKTSNQIDCMAEPQYTCDCISNLCQVK